MLTITILNFVGTDTLIFCDGWARKNRSARSGGREFFGVGLAQCLD
jgi:hypothetical protein